MMISYHFRPILVFIAIADVSRLHLYVVESHLLFDLPIDALRLSLLTILGCHLQGKDDTLEGGKLLYVIFFK